MNKHPFKDLPPLREGYEERIWQRIEAVLTEERAQGAGAPFHSGGASAPIHTLRRRQRLLRRLAVAAAVAGALGASWWLRGGESSSPAGGMAAPGPGGPRVAAATEPAGRSPRVRSEASPAPGNGRSALPEPAANGPVQLTVALASPLGTSLEYASLALQPVDATGRSLGQPLTGASLRAWRRHAPLGRLRLALPAGSLPPGTVALEVHPRGPEGPAAGRLPLGRDQGGEEVPPPLTSTATYAYGAVVVDADTGLPLAGVAVRYVPADPAFDPARNVAGAAPDTCPLEFTGADGAFAGLTDHTGPHSLVLALPGYVPEQLDDVRPDEATGLPATIPLRRGRTLAGVVRDASGAPVPDLLLRLGGGFPRRADKVARALGWRRFQTIRTAADGSFQASGFAEAGSDTFLVVADVLGLARTPDPLAGTATWLELQEVPYVADPALDEVALEGSLEDAFLAGPGWLGLPLAAASAGSLELTLDLHVLEILVQDYDLVPALDASVRIRPQTTRLASLEVPVDPARGTARILVPAGQELRLTASNPAGQEAGLTVVPPVGPTPHRQLTLTLFPQDRAGVDFILRDSPGGLVAGARSAPLYEDLPTEAASAIPVRPGSPEGHYRLLLPPGHHVLALFGPPSPAGAIGPFGFATLEVDLADGQYLDLGELTLPRGLAVQIRLLAGLGDSSLDPTEALDPVALVGRPVALLARGSGALQPARVLVTPRPDWFPEATGVEALRPHYADWNWDPALGDWVRHFYLRQRIEAGSWSLQVSLPGLVDPVTVPIQADGGDGVVTVDLHLPPPSGG